MSMYEKVLYDSNTENTHLRKANEVLRNTLKTIAMTSREQHVRDLAYRELEETK